MRFSNSNVLPTSFDCNEYPSDSGRNPIGWRTESDRVADAFKGVHLSQVHQQSNIDTPLILLVQFLLAWLVHFLLWQAAKPSGDKCTPKENTEE